MRILRSSTARRALAVFIPAAAAATLCCGLAYALVHFELRAGANDPQQQLAEDAAAALDGGATPSSVVGPGKVDVAASLAPFVVVFDSDGAVVATNGTLDGHDPIPPKGVLDSARENGPDAVTWQPREGVRVATVTVGWNGGSVLAGRSLRVVEHREDQVLWMAAAGWVIALLVLAAAAIVAAWVWPSSGGGPVTRLARPGPTVGGGPGS
ncbi:MAG: hypothetical protein ACHQ3P_02015 [Candidatus Limnocylindrales bacterium]